jgi:hypothetical protein
MASVDYLKLVRPKSRSQLLVYGAAVSIGHVR